MKKSVYPKRCQTCGVTRSVKIPICNACGLSCSLRSPQGPYPSGLVEATVSGGYESTAGNGYGALDDLTTYTFSLCEFCLDALFSQLRVPPRVAQMGTPSEGEYESAADRIRTQPWRAMGDLFREESARRARRRKR